MTMRMKEGDMTSVAKSAIFSGQSVVGREVMMFSSAMATESTTVK
jgi:hypothetical protein